MAFTMHAHSGQFCPGHAVDQLEDIILHAISLGYKTIGLTEHMPRYEEQDLYPEEVCLTLPCIHLFPSLVYYLALHSILLTPTPPSHIHMSLILSHSPSHTTTLSFSLTQLLTQPLTHILLTHIPPKSQHKSHKITPHLTLNLQLSDPQASLQALPPRHEAYILEARRLQKKYSPQIHIIIAFEAEFIRPSYAPLVQALFDASPHVDYFIGSVHHVHSIPIDYDKATYAAGVTAAGGSEERLYEDYYDLQYEMLKALKPRIVGHFDLIRLMSEDPGRDVRQWSGVWEKIRRNLEYAEQIGAWLECNSAALRKGLDEPYPGRIISEVSYIQIPHESTSSPKYQHQGIFY